jgi:hypothetical protein
MQTVLYREPIGMHRTRETDVVCNHSCKHHQDRAFLTAWSIKPRQMGETYLREISLQPRPHCTVQKEKVHSHGLQKSTSQTSSQIHFLKTAAATFFSCATAFTRSFSSCPAETAIRMLGRNFLFSIALHLVVVRRREALSSACRKENEST